MFILNISFWIARLACFLAWWSWKLSCTIWIWANNMVRAFRECIVLTPNMTSIFSTSNYSFIHPILPSTCWVATVASISTAKTTACQKIFRTNPRVLASVGMNTIPISHSFHGTKCLKINGNFILYNHQLSSPNKIHNYSDHEFLLWICIQAIPLWHRKKPAN